MTVQQVLLDVSYIDGFVAGGATGLVIGIFIAWRVKVWADAMRKKGLEMMARDIVFLQDENAILNARLNKAT